MSHMTNELHNVRIKPSNVKKRKSKGTIKCEKRTVIYNIGTAQCEVGTIKCEKKIREPSNVRKELSYVILKLHNVKLEPLNVRKKIREPQNVINKMSHMTKELSHVTKKEHMRCWYCLI